MNEIFLKNRNIQNITDMVLNYFNRRTK